MSVSGINGLPLNQTIDQTGMQNRFAQAFAPVAQLFGESSDQLMSELKTGGTSLTALAQQKGISQTDLVNAIKQGLQQSSANGAPALSDTQMTNIANRIAGHKHGGHHHHHAAAGATDAAGSSDGTGSASALKLDVEKLMADLQQAQQAQQTQSSQAPTNDSTSTSVPGASTSSSELLDQLTRFDQSL